MRYAILFLLVGLAIGLWLGFNPAAHRDLVRWWDRANTSEKSSTIPGIPSLTQLNRRASRVLRSTPRPQVVPQSEPSTVPTGIQISTELQAFWNALQRIWLQILASISRPG